MKDLINSMCSLDPDRRPPAASVRDQLFQMIPQEQRGPLSSLAPKLSKPVEDFEIQQSHDPQHSQAFNSNSASEYTQVDAEHVPTPEFPNKRKQSDGRTDERSSKKKNPSEEPDNSGGGYSSLHEEVHECADEKDTNLYDELAHTTSSDWVRYMC